MKVQGGKMPIPPIDNDALHLFPPFRAKVEAVLAEATRECVGKFALFNHWVLGEGYRSVARQRALYDQGRSAPGEIVTNDPVPHFHGYGLAADLWPVNARGSVLWQIDAQAWQVLRHCAHLQDLLSGSDWAHFPDRPHMQPHDAEFAEWKPLAVAYLKGLGLGAPG
jgi:peptidoglycan L-alanyl-D-glutamate endopeptidase CwlK